MKKAFLVTVVVGVITFLAGKTYEAIKEEKEELKHMEVQNKNFHDIVDNLQKLNTVSTRNHEKLTELARKCDELDQVDAFFIDGYKKGYFEEVGFF